MSALQNFAENLRRLCLHKDGNISASARGMGIGRSQIESYLQARRAPSRSSLKRICDYLEVREEDMYQRPSTSRQKGNNRSATQTLQILAEAQSALEPLLLYNPTAKIEKGFYNTFFTMPGIANKLLCAITVIAKEGNATTFRRLTNRSFKKDEYWSRFTGNHKGIVVERLNCLSFIGVNQAGTHEPTLIRMNWLPFSDKVLSGSAMIFSPSSPAFSAVVMTPVSTGIPLKSALRTAQRYSSSEEDIPKFVLDTIASQKADFIATIQRDLGL